VTVNFVGEGKAWYVASRNDAAFQRDFFMNIAEELNLARALDTQFPYGVTAHRRTDGESEFIVVENYSNDSKSLVLPAVYRDMVDQQPVQGSLTLAPWGSRVLTRYLE
ncbi:Beta-galactosidase C-terminal domain, partial [Yersinia pestis]